ncbi:MAG: ABC transporter ATP-binding protein, partial [Thaumarchaeota archaeon]|nr:ABC transporter ATP-binding protein [Nitrososphaerota archaeon]
MSTTVLSVKGLNLHIGRGAKTLQVLHDIDLNVTQGETLGLIGETGCGKTMTSRSIIRLLPDTASVTGEVTFSGRNVLTCSKKELMDIRRNEIAMIPQNPMTSLDPMFSIRELMHEILTKKISKEERDAKSREALRSVELDPEQVLRSKPYELSGGMLQRVLIAMALVRNPKLIIADEVTTALDVTTQLKVLDLVKRLRAERNLSLIVVTHDMKVVNALCDYVSVMYLGRIVESGSVQDILKNPKHPYTQALLRATPAIGIHRFQRWFSQPRAGSNLGAG